MPGQFIFGRDSASKQLKMPSSTVWKRIIKLKNLQILNIDSNSHYSIITIVNWDSYQNGNEKGDSDRDSEGTGKEQRGNTNKKVIRKLEESNKKNNKSILKSFSYPDWLNLDLWFEFSDMRSRTKHPITSSTGITRLLNSLKKLIDDGYAQDEIIGLALERGWRGFFPPNDFNQSTKLTQEEHDERERIVRQYRQKT